MKKYTVELRASKDAEVEAESALEAVKIAREQNPDYHADGIYDNERYELVESCNGCGNDMLEEEVGGSDTDGNTYCKECYEASASEYLSWIHDLTTLGYEKGLMLSADHKEEIDELYGDKEPAEALEYLIENNLVVKMNS